MIRLLFAAAIAVPCVGCASVTRGTTENISIATTPAGATADISGLEIPTACITPCVVQAKRSADVTVTINKEGYEPQTISLTKEVPGSGAAGFAGNLLAGGLIGMGVDAATGAAQDHKPNPVIVTLQPLAPAPPLPAAAPAKAIGASAELNFPAGKFTAHRGMGSKSNGKRCPDQGAAAQAGEVRNTITNNGPLISTRSMPAWLVLEVRLGKSPGDEQGLASLRRLCDLMSRKGPAYLCPDNGRLKWFKPDPDQ